MIAKIPKLKLERAVTRSACTYACWNAAPAATAISVVMPGTLANVAEPRGRASSSATREDAGRPAASTAGGTSRVVHVVSVLETGSVR